MDQVEEIKRKTDIVALIGQYVELKKAGRNHKGLCPFHGEKSPSFMVNEEIGVYKCFGCGVGGDVIKFLMEIEGIDFPEALERLAEKAGVKLERFAQEDNSTRKKLLEILSLSAEYYHYLLTEHVVGETARKYLADRNINEKLIETFKLGFSMNSWDGLVSYLIGKKNYTEEELVRAGMAVKRDRGGVYDKFRGRLMFPLLDSGGKVIGFTARIIPGISDDQEAKYMNSPETEVYHKGEMLYGFYQAKQFIRERKRVVIVEGQMDLISSYGAGVGETVAVSGTALTKTQIEMISRLTDKIIFAQDADLAGENSVKKSVELAEQKGMNIKVVSIVGGKDPDEIARKSPELWKKMVEESVSVYEWMMKRSLERHAGSEDKIREVAKETIPYLARIEQKMERDMWTRKLSESLGVSKESVDEDVEKVRRGRVTNLGESVVKTSVSEKDGALNNLKQLIGMLAESNRERIGEVKKWFEDIELEGAEGKLLRWLFDSRQGTKIKEYIDQVPSELRAVFDEIVMKYDGEEIQDKDLKMVLSKVLKELIDNKVDVLERKLTEAEKEGDEEMVQKLSIEVNRLIGKKGKISVLI